MYYSCMDNMEKLVKKHNNNVLRKNDTNKRNCNCPANNTCLLDGKCLSSNIVYSAEVRNGNNQHGDTKPGYVTINIHLKTDKKKKTLIFLNIYGT